MSQQRPLLYDATGRVIQLNDTDTLRGAAAPAVGTDLTNKTYVDNADANVNNIQGVALNTLTVNGAPFDQAVLKYVKSANQWRAEMWETPFYLYIASGTTLGRDAIGPITITEQGTVSQNAGTDTLPPNKKILSAATAGSSASCQSSFNNNIAFRFWRNVRFLFQLGQTTNMRIWVGLTDSVSTSQAGWRTDTPNFNFVGFRFSPTTAGDTHWKAITQTSSANQDVVDTGVTPVTSITADLLFNLIWDDTNWNFYIQGTQVASKNTKAPAANTTPCVPIIMLDNAATANAVFFNIYSFAGQGRSY